MGHLTARLLNPPPCSMHDDALLVHEQLALHSFRSPYTATFRARQPPSALLMSPTGRCRSCCNDQNACCTLRFTINSTCALSGAGAPLLAAAQLQQYIAGPVHIPVCHSALTLQCWLFHDEKLLIIQTMLLVCRRLAAGHRGVHHQRQVGGPRRHHVAAGHARRPPRRRANRQREGPLCRPGTVQNFTKIFDILVILRDEEFGHACLGACVRDGRSPLRVVHHACALRNLSHLPGAGTRAS